MSIYYMTTTDRAAAIRSALKAKGYTSRQVSVRADGFSMGSAIRIQIKDASVPSSLVKAIAEPHESIRRCAITGDILGGGNTYVTVSYTSEAWLNLSNAYEARVAAAFAQVSDNVLKPVDGTPFMVGRGWQGSVSVWGDGRHVLDACDVREAAAAIGQRMVEVQ